jgi:preprotein translocase subunit SecG
LTRTTAILAALFFASAIGLTILAELDRGTSGILEGASQGGQTPTTVLDALQQMQQQSQGDLPIPGGGVTPAPATEAAPAVDPGLALPATPAAEPAPAAPAADAAPAAPADGATTAPAIAAPATAEQPAAQ